MVMFDQLFSLNSKIDTALGSKDWAFTALEGNSALYYDKTVLLQHYSDDSRVHTICEVHCLEKQMACIPLSFIYVCRVAIYDVMSRLALMQATVH